MNLGIANLGIQGLRSTDYPSTIFRTYPSTIFGATGQAGQAQIDADYLSLTENTEAQRERTGGLENIRFRTTWDIIEAAERGLLPDKVMLNTHPQRWTDRPLPWVKEFVGQNVKNVIKRYFYVRTW